MGVAAEPPKAYVSAQKLFASLAGKMVVKILPLGMLKYYWDNLILNDRLVNEVFRISPTN